jgi:hypothetical protein
MTPREEHILDVSVSVVCAVDPSIRVERGADGEFSAWSDGGSLATHAPTSEIAWAYAAISVKSRDKLAFGRIFRLVEVTRAVQDWDGIDEIMEVEL